MDTVYVVDGAKFVMDKVQPLLLQIADVRGGVLMPTAVTLPESISKQAKCMTTNFHRIHLCISCVNQT